MQVSYLPRPTISDTVYLCLGQNRFLACLPQIYGCHLEDFIAQIHRHYGSDVAGAKEESARGHLRHVDLNIEKVLVCFRPELEPHYQHSSGYFPLLCNSLELICLFRLYPRPSIREVNMTF